MRFLSRVALALLVPLALASIVVAATPDAGGGAPRYTADGRLISPADYREWIYLSSGVDMSYDPAALASKEPVFDNVFASPAAYRAFVKTGTWPDKTQLVAETRGSSGKGSINHRGRFQNGDVVDVEVHVKDRTRFGGDGWAFFAIGDGKPAEKIPTDADCYSCHRKNAAVDTSFVQFYPTLLSIARRHRTLSAAYLANEAAR